MHRYVVNLFFFFAGIVTTAIGFGGCLLCDSCRGASWLFTCGYCFSTPLQPTVRTMLSAYDPIEPIALSISRSKERGGGTYLMHYSEERPCICAHCWTCYDDLYDRLPVEEPSSGDFINKDVIVSY
mmetsp:Transcript_18500/g.27856  ORF Transcript_18500/g.27856 Transcript_18500/m.27856 type:complete len:126 (-) Transcript_18500:257-634(-)